MRMTGFVTAAVVAALTFTGCAPKEAQDQKKAEPVAVRTTAVELVENSAELQYSGVVAPDTQTELAFRIPGYIEQLGQMYGREVQEGDVVPAGFVLARLRKSEYAIRSSYAQTASADATATLGGLRAQTAEAETALQHATLEWNRAKTLFEAKALTRADYDAVQAKRDAAAARRDAASAQVAAQQARIDGANANLKATEIDLGDTALTAPFPGIVVSKRVARGTLATAGAAAFVLADTRIAKIAFSVPDLAVANLRLGEFLTVRSEAFDGMEFRGRISQIGASADAADRSFPVELSIPNPQQKLRVGMVVSVNQQNGAKREPSPAIPLSAVVKTGNSFAVYKVDGTHVRLQAITLGEALGSRVAVASGLVPGEKVVSMAGLQLSDGEAVRIIP
jgi:multidrug efflux pump subunit AcrA (membrane-fusion protein)